MLKHVLFNYALYCNFKFKGEIVQICPCHLLIVFSNIYLVDMYSCLKKTLKSTVPKLCNLLKLRTIFSSNIGRF